MFLRLDATWLFHSAHRLDLSFVTFLTPPLVPQKHVSTYERVFRTNQRAFVLRFKLFSNTLVLRLEELVAYRQSPSVGPLDAADWIYKHENLRKEDGLKRDDL